MDIEILDNGSIVYDGYQLGPERLFRLKDILSKLVERDLELRFDHESDHLQIFKGTIELSYNRYYISHFLYTQQPHKMEHFFLNFKEKIQSAYDACQGIKFTI